MKSSDRDGLENTFPQERPRHTPLDTRHTQKSSNAVQLRHMEPATVPPNGVEARRRRRSRCGRCTSVRPAGQRTTRSSPSSCAGREHERLSGSTTHAAIARPYNSSRWLTGGSWAALARAGRPTGTGMTRVRQPLRIVHLTESSSTRPLQIVHHFGSFTPPTSSDRSPIQSNCLPTKSLNLVRVKIHDVCR